MGSKTMNIAYNENLFRFLFVFFFRDLNTPESFRVWMTFVKMSVEMIAIDAIIKR